MVQTVSLSIESVELSLRSGVKPGEPLDLTFPDEALVLSSIRSHLMFLSNSRTASLLLYAGLSKDLADLLTVRCGSKDVTSKTLTWQQLRTDAMERGSSVEEDLDVIVSLPAHGIDKATVYTKWVFVVLLLLNVAYLMAYVWRSVNDTLKGSSCWQGVTSAGIYELLSNLANSVTVLCAVYYLLCVSGAGASSLKYVSLAPALENTNFIGEKSW